MTRTRPRTATDRHGPPDTPPQICTRAITNPDPQVSCSGSPVMSSMSPSLSATTMTPREATTRCEAPPLPSTQRHTGENTPTSGGIGSLDGGSIIGHLLLERSTLTSCSSRCSSRRSSSSVHSCRQGPLNRLQSHFQRPRGRTTIYSKVFRVGSSMIVHHTHQSTFGKCTRGVSATATTHAGPAVSAPPI